MIYRFFLLVWHVGKGVISWIGESMVFVQDLENPKHQKEGFCGKLIKASE